MGPSIEANIAPVLGASGQPTAVHETVFTTVPGSPAYVGRASQFWVNVPNFKIDLKGHSAVSTSFRFTS
jgi:hypothetical protein